VKKWAKKAKNPAPKIAPNFLSEKWAFFGNFENLQKWAKNGKNRCFAPNFWFSEPIFEKFLVQKKWHFWAKNGQKRPFLGKKWAFLGNFW